MTREYVFTAAVWLLGLLIAVAALTIGAPS